MSINILLYDPGNQAPHRGANLEPPLNRHDSDVCSSWWFDMARRVNWASMSLPRSAQERGGSFHNNV